MEVITGPRPDLLHLARDHEEAVHRLVTVAAEHGARVLGMGTQPKTPPSLDLMTPKPRYGVMLEALGDPWLTFTATASDQTHVDIAGPEIVSTMNLCNLLSPIIIALCGNSGVVAGADAEVCSWREHAMGTIQPEHGRHGMPVEPASTLAHHMEMLCSLPHLMDRVDGEAFLGDGEPFSAFMRTVEGERSWKAFLVHDHYVWHSARPRHRQGTIEIRCACQQPWQEHMAASALALGLVAGAAEIAGFVQSKLGMDVWQVMRDWHTQVVRHGLAAPEPVDGLIEGVLERAKGALRGRGRQEAALLEPLFRRLQRKQNPAQRARALLADEGLAALIDAVSIPASVE